MKKTYLLRSAVLTAFLIFSHIIASAYYFQVDGIYYNITSTTDLTVEVTYKTTSYNSYSGDVTIPETVTYNSITYTVTGIGGYAFRKCTSLTSITIPDAVESIGDYAFYNCSSLPSITIPDAVTTIGSYAFLNCTQLTSLTIPVTASFTTYKDSRSKCPFENTVLTDLTITGKGDMMDNAFYNFTALENVTLSEGITSIGESAFYGCISLTSITIPEAVTSIGDYAFYNCI